MKFTIELLSSKFEQFDTVGNEVTAAERQLIQRWSPCFNEALNSRPTAVPPAYRPLTARLRCGRSLNKLMHEAERAVKVEETALWMRETG